MKPKFFFRQKPSTLPYKTKNFKRKKKVKILNNKRLRAGVTKREMRYGMEWHGGETRYSENCFFFLLLQFLLDCCQICMQQNQWKTNSC
jgi:hypothetical protein